MHQMTVTATCESCDHHYTYGFGLTPIVEEKTSYFNYGDRQMVSGTSYKYAQDPETLIKNSVRPCPFCGYVQSWMIPWSLKMRRALWGAGCFMTSLLMPLIAAIPLTKADSIRMMQGPQSASVKALELTGNIIIGVAVAIFIASLPFLTGAFDFLIKPNRGRPKPDRVTKPTYSISR